MIWAYLAILGAFGQALGWAFKKKALNANGLNNTLGFISYTCAALGLWGLWTADHVSTPLITQRFIGASAVTITLNVLASWCAYRVLDKNELSKLMPYMAITALMMIPVEYVLRNVLPNGMQVIGMCIVIAGAVMLGGGKISTLRYSDTARYFGITLVCYSITSPCMTIMVEESGDPFFSAVIMHAGIAVGFFPLLLYAKELKSIGQLRSNGQWIRTLVPMCLTGLIVAFLENGPIFAALESANASEVFALKRTMPFFALLLGVFWFRERIRMVHVLSTLLLVAGSLIIMLYKQ